MIRIRRVYEPSASGEGTRFLVERLWPRGVKKESLHAKDWLKDVAPSDALRRWFAHDPKKWPEFQRRYTAELDAHPEAWRPVLAAARRGSVTLLCSTRDTEHNSAVVLRNYVQARLGSGKAANPR